MNTKTFLRLSSLLVPVEQIRQLNLDARLPNGDSFIEIFLHGMQEPFNIDGQAARVAFDSLKPYEETIANQPPPSDFSYIMINTPSGVVPSPVPVNVIIGGDSFNAMHIEWVDFQTQFEDGLGVEVRLSTDAPGTTRQYLGDMASVAYDALSILAVNPIAATV